MSNKLSGRLPEIYTFYPRYACKRFAVSRVHLINAKAELGLKKGTSVMQILAIDCNYNVVILAFAKRENNKKRFMLVAINHTRKINALRYTTFGRLYSFSAKNAVRLPKFSHISES